MDKILLYKLTVSRSIVKEKIVPRVIKVGEDVKTEGSWFNRTKRIEGIYSTINEIQEEDGNESITYELNYHIDEDRFWYTKTKENGETEGHHTKKGFEGSIQIMNDMTNRYLKLTEGREDIVIDIYDIRISNEELLNTILANTKDLNKQQEGYFLK